MRFSAKFEVGGPRISDLVPVDAMRGGGVLALGVRI